MTGLPILAIDIKAALKDGRIVGFECAGCKRRQFTPMAICAACKGRDIKAVDLPHEGTVDSYTIQSVSSEEFINDVPYAFVIVKLTDGTRVTGWIPYIASQRDLAIGDKVRFTPSYKPGIQFEKA